MALASRVRPLPDQPARSAIVSSTIQPTLWRVFAYWSPGLPRPTTIFTRPPLDRLRSRPGNDPSATPTGPDPVAGGPGRSYQPGVVRRPPRPAPPSVGSAVRQQALLEGAHLVLLARLGVVPAAEMQRAVGDQQPQL